MSTSKRWFAWVTYGLFSSMLTLGCAEEGDFAAEERAGEYRIPSGPHYNLNIIGVDKGKSPEMTGNQGHRIFVPMRSKTRIDLAPGDFKVLDANGTDGRAAFQLPHPDPDGDGVTEYEVYARALGKPGGESKTTTCGTDDAGETYCSTSSVLLRRAKGKSSFTNVTNDLLFIEADIDGDGDLETLPLFDEALTEYFWEYDNNGLRLAQLRFYQVAEPR